MITVKVNLSIDEKAALVQAMEALAQASHMIGQAEAKTLPEMLAQADRQIAIAKAQTTLETLVVG